MATILVMVEGDAVAVNGGHMIGMGNIDQEDLYLVWFHDPRSTYMEFIPRDDELLVDDIEHLVSAFREQQELRWGKPGDVKIVYVKHREQIVNIDTMKGKFEWP